jgi:hypothetical protein
MWEARGGAWFPVDGLDVRDRIKFVATTEVRLEIITLDSLRLDRDVLDAHLTYQRLAHT